MIYLPFILLGTLILSTFIGWIIHWTLHQSWSLWFYKAHMNHHTIQYPPSDLLSEKYRSAGKDSTVWLFLIAFMPIIGVILLLWFFGIISLLTCVMIVVSLAAWGLIHNYFHDQFHLIQSFWSNSSYFNKLKNLHLIHHFDMSKNLGIVIFSWDKLFKTFDKEIGQL